MTSSPLLMSRSSAARSSADVHEWVSSALAQPVLLLDPLMAALCERAVAGEMEIALRLGRVNEFLARRKGPVEWDSICCHWVGFTG